MKRILCLALLLTGCGSRVPAPVSPSEAARGRCTAGVDKATYLWDVGGPGGPDRVTPIATLQIASTFRSQRSRSAVIKYTTLAASTMANTGTRGIR